MLDFIVLGLIPGTNLKLTFSILLGIVCVCVVSIFLSFKLRSGNLRKLFSNLSFKF